MEAVHRILVVDDEADVRDWLQSLLQDAGFAVDGVADGKAMRAALVERTYALLVLDLRLRGEDGLQLARE
ncbi:response regulator [Vogesella indigofera]|uniref:Response regulator n=1 Tax=Vogesella indigofera TaxID=45465 RepID=A0ABT5I9N6_VOGIN|nr:response regulator [Vogesella indigofera]MDC7692171.1 response regulator [Vogesella indigofera]